MKVRVFLVLMLAIVLAFGCGIKKDVYNKEVAKANALQKNVDDLTKQTADLKKANDDLSKSLKDSNDQLAKRGAEVSETKKQLEQRTESYEQLTKSLKSEISKGQIELSNIKGKLSVKLKDKILFSSGSVKINKEGIEALKKIADAFKEMKDKRVLVEGHTDNVPPGGSSPYKDNWDLSVARAVVVVRLLQESGLDPTRLEAAGMGEYQPIASNDTAEGRSLNRRIELDLLPIDKADQVAAPVPAPQAAPAAKQEVKQAPKAEAKDAGK